MGEFFKKLKENLFGKDRRKAEAEQPPSANIKTSTPPITQPVPGAPERREPYFINPNRA